MHNDLTAAAIDSGRSFLNGASGQWAGRQFLAALESGGTISPASLRTLGVLREDDWKVFDTELVVGASLRLRGVADLIAAGLTKTIPNGLAKTILEYEQVGDLTDANVSLDGMTRGMNDSLEFGLAGLPLPIIHKDFYLNLRRLLASRSGRGEPLDTAHIRAAGRKIAETAERLLFQGHPGNFMGLPIYGYTTHPNRNTVAFGAGGSWALAAKTGAEVLADVATLLSLANADRMYGPYWLYVGTAMSTKLAEDFKATGDKTIAMRILDNTEITSVRVADQMPANAVVLVQATPDVVQWVTGEPLQTVQWDIQGGFQINFKGFTIQVPLIRATADGNSGIVHMS
jgi:uncharacterized linocin/CFP29 family protein